MDASKKSKNGDENEEYSIVDEKAPSGRVTMGMVHRYALRNPEKVLDALGIRDGTYDLTKIDRETGRVLHTAILMYSGDSPSREELRTIESRALAYNGHSILTPEDISRTFEKRPDIGAIRAANGILQMIGSIRNNSDMPLLDHGDGQCFMTEEEKTVLRGMMEYRNAVITNIHVERPTQDEIDSWIRLFMKLMARMYTVAVGQETGCNRVGLQKTMQGSERPQRSRPR